MLRIRVIGLCVVVACALSAMAAASAPAAEVLLHTWKECSKAAKGTGHYTSKECTLASKVETGGKYELLEVKKRKFTIKSKTSKLFAFVPENEALPLGGGPVVGEVVCKSDAGEGEIVNEKLSTSFLLFKGCTSGGVDCTSAGEPLGAIKTFELSTEPQLWQGKVLLLTSAAAGLGTQPLARFTCGLPSQEPVEITILGAVLGLALLNVQQAVKKAHDKLSVNVNHGQEHVFYECLGGLEGVCQDFLTTDVSPPGVTLYASLETLEELKYTGAIGIYPI